MIEADTLVLGAGLTGLTVADGLARAGGAPVVLEKSRGVGGRLATRRLGDAQFDHGAQYLRAKTRGFAHFLDRMERAGTAAAWSALDGPCAHVGVPGMAGLVRPLAENVRVETHVEVALAERRDGLWQLAAATGEPVARAPRLVCTIPAPQAARVLAGHPMARDLAGIVFDPCWTLMVSFDAAPALDLLERRPGAPLAWIARDSGKPGRRGETWVAQAGPDWTRAHLEHDRDAVTANMLALLSDRSGGVLPGILQATAHRWRYAQAARPLGRPCLADADCGLVVAGDWCLGTRAEDAFRSGLAALDVLDRH